MFQGMNQALPLTFFSHHDRMVPQHRKTQHRLRTLTWRHCLVSKQRCWFQGSRCYPRSLCQKPGCHGNQRHRGRRWSGKQLGSKADLEADTREFKEKRKRSAVVTNVTSSSFLRGNAWVVPVCVTPSRTAVCPGGFKFGSQSPATVRCVYGFSWMGEKKKSVQMVGLSN